jgi:transposase
MANGGGSGRRLHPIVGIFGAVAVIFRFPEVPVAALIRNATVDDQAASDLTHAWWTHRKEQYLLWEVCFMQRKAYTRYSREFKLEAVRQAALGEKPKAQIARALGIRVGHLRDWRLQFEEEARTGVVQPPPAVGQDLEQLRRENAKLKVENEILKKAAIYFAGESK